MATTPSANDLTRQQLDELDLLLQRMLSSPNSTQPRPVPVPTSPLPQPPELLAPTWRMDPPAMDVRSPHMLHDTEALLLVEQPSRKADLLGSSYGAETSMPVAYAPAPLPTPTVPFSPPKLPDLVPETPFAGSTYTLPGSPSRLPEFDRIDLEALKTPEQPIVLLQAAGTVTNAPAMQPKLAKVPLLLWPLFACNWVIEAVLRQFDATVTSPKYKQVLGTLGVLMLIVAGIWAARGMGVNLKVK